MKMHPFAFTKSSLQLSLLCFLGGVLLPGSLAKDYWEAGLKKHNEYREGHKTPLLELDSGLAEMADKCAQYYADKGGIDHTCPDKNGAGENLYQSWGIDSGGVKAVNSAIENWYNEIEHYDFGKHESKGGVVGHFTQVVWKGSKKLGMGFAQKDKTIVVVGLYSPPGNYRGKDKENVLPPTGAGAGAGAGGSDSDKSSASRNLIRGQKLQDATCLALVMSVGLLAGGF